MSGILLIIISVVWFVLGYTIYGRFVSNRLGVKPERPTPAHSQTDNVDYVPAKTPVLLGHHFASIAGAGPIVGPIIAIKYGWVPVLLWILLGVVFVGAVHDFASLIASVRHRGKSIGEVIEAYVGPAGKVLFLLFSWSTLLLVIAVFIDIVANTFVGNPAVATASGLFIALAVAFGFAAYRLRLPLAVASVLGVIGLGVCVWLGFTFPLDLPYAVWVGLLVAYIFVASVTPVWVLLQPRDYLSSFLLYFMMLGMVVGIFVFNPGLKVPAIGAFVAPGTTEYAFPFLFVIVACGAISGFHSLVASGTTAKQLNNEKDARVIGYGGMLIEGLLAVVALIAVGLLAAGERTGSPVAVFSAGAGRLIEAIPVLNVSAETGGLFVALTVSVFCLTSLDTGTRIARFAFQEFFEWEGRRELFRPLRNRFVATAITVGAGAFLAFYGAKVIWPIFGAANQMLAALALLAVTVWLTALGRKRWFVLLPMVLMFVITLSALSLKLYEYVFIDFNPALLVISAVLLVLSVSLAGLAFVSVGRRERYAVVER
jgi:carbon starvation protein